MLLSRKASIALDPDVLAVVAVLSVADHREEESCDVKHEVMPSSTTPERCDTRPETRGLTMPTGCCPGQKHAM